MKPRPLPLAALAAVVLLAGCVERRSPAPVVFRGTQPGGVAPAPTVAAVPAPSVDVAALPGAAAPLPTAGAGADARGVVNYGGYSAIVARPGDTVQTMASRAGVSAQALAAYNGLPASFTPRAGDELILPPSPTAGMAAPASSGMDVAALESTLSIPPASAQPAAIPAAPQPVTPAPSQQGSIATLDLDAIEATLGGGGPQSSPQSSPQPTPAPVAVPAPAAAPATQPSAPAAAAQVAAVQPPAAQPAPQPARPAARFVTPVDGRISRPFSRGGDNRNDGVDFTAAAGAPVRAAANGQVALVSESLGGLGTIVLIRHEGDLLTVYGRVDGVTVQKGDRVTQGQTIGGVAGGANPSLHFEVRRGADSVDPTDYLPG